MLLNCVLGSESMSGNSDRWKEIQESLEREIEEVESELNRQRLLDELSASRTRNLELETALAKLAREQDRLALFERERILKRAQIAQATAVLVQEANWAKNRMEAEMRMAKQRAMMFPETEVSASFSGVRPGTGSFNIPPAKAPAVPPWEGSVTAPPPEPTVPADNKRLKSSPSMAAEIPSIERTPQSLPEISSTPPLVIESPAPAQVAVETSVIESSIKDTVAEIQASSEVSEVISNAYTNVMTSIFGKTDGDPIIAPVVNVETPTDTVESVKETLPSSSFPKPFPPPTSSLPIPQALSANPEEKPQDVAKTASVVMPTRTQLRMNEPKKVLRTVAKGEWTNPELQSQASSVLSQLIGERDIIILSKEFLMASMFGLPLKESSELEPAETHVEWKKIAEEWAKAPSGGNASDQKNSKPSKATKIDPAIAILAGVDPDLKDENEEISKPVQENSQLSPEKQVEQPKETPTVDLVKDKVPDKRKSKDGCSIM